MKTVRSGNPKRPSKFVKFRREAKRLEKKFGKGSHQMQHFLSSREAWASKVS